MKHNLTLILLAAAVIFVASCTEDGAAPFGSGMIEATETVVSAETTGRLERLYFDEGDRLDRGDTLALIDTAITVLKLKQADAMHMAATAGRKKAAIQIEQAAANDSLAQKEFDRIQRLLESGAANRQEFDRAKNALDQARLGYQAARVALSAAEAELARIESEINLLKEQYADCRPLSPIGGTVVTTYVEEGELLAPGKPILKIAQIDTVWVKIYVPPQDLTDIKLGDVAEVDPEDGRETPMTGAVTWISDEAEFTPKNVQTKEARADLVYAVKITVPNPDEILKVGMPVSVRIP